MVRLKIDASTSQEQRDIDSLFGFVVRTTVLLRVCIEMIGGGFFFYSSLEDIISDLLREEVAVEWTAALWIHLETTLVDRTLSHDHRKGSCNEKNLQVR
jgi:hypothetical protein